MEFSLTRSIEVLEQTPLILYSMLNNLSPEWTDANEGENTWTAREVVAHLIVCEETNWLLRTKIILSDSQTKTFDPIDMIAHFEIARNNTLQDLIKKFKTLRENSIKEIKAFNLYETDFKKTGVHPKLGVVNLQQLISTWVTHDLTHIAQIARVMAKQNRTNVGAFETFLNILKS